MESYLEQLNNDCDLMTNRISVIRGELHVLEVEKKRLGVKL